MDCRDSVVRGSVAGLCDTGLMDVDTALPLILLITLLAIGVFFLYLHGFHRGVNKSSRAASDLEKRGREETAG